MKSRSNYFAIFAVGIVMLLSELVSAQNQLVYVSFLTGLTKGGTNVYQISSSGALLIGTLNNGGGGPAAVDAQQNVYVVQADLGNGGYQVNSPVYMFPPGGTQGTLIFTAKNIGAEAMTVGADGTVYIAGQVPNSNTFAVVKFSPPDYSPLVLGSAQNPRYPVGISVDSAGDIFVGWLDSVDSGYPFTPCTSGCITELKAGQSNWQIRLPDLAANSMAAGPFATTDGSLIFWTGGDGRFEYFETVPAGAHYPSQLIQESPTLFQGNPILAFNGGGTELWATGFGLGAPLGTSVVGINYPSGSVALTFPVNTPGNLLWISGIAVSPAYFP